jgi:hypothetical protein
MVQVVPLVPAWVAVSVAVSPDRDCFLQNPGRMTADLHAWDLSRCILMVGMSPKEIDRQPPIALPTDALRVSPVVHGIYRLLRDATCDAPLAMTRRDRIVGCGDRMGTPQYQLEKCSHGGQQVMLELSL